MRPSTTDEAAQTVPPGNYRADKSLTCLDGYYQIKIEDTYAFVRDSKGRKVICDAGSQHQSSLGK